MPKVKFDTFESTCVPLPYENVDTDQIIPARFLSATSRQGFGDNLSATGDIQRQVRKTANLFSIIQHTMGRYLLPVKILEADQVANMLSGLFLIMDSGQSFQAFSQIFS